MSLRHVYPYSTSSHGAFVAVQWRFCEELCAVFQFQSYISCFIWDSILNGSFVFVSMKGKILVLRNVFFIYEGLVFSGTFYLLLFQVTFINISKYGMVFSSLSPTHSSLIPSSPAQHIS